MTSFNTTNNTSHKTPISSNIKLDISTKKRRMCKLSPVWITGPSQSKFEDNYIKLKQIGQPGSFGCAYKIKRISDGKILAVKEISKAKIYRLHPSDTMRQSLLKSMESEIDIMRRLDHKYIVNMYETYETKHKLYIIMELCHGGELFDRIKQRGRYKEHDCKIIIKQICEALFYMHDKHKVLHSDLKPSNILFISNEKTSNIKIIDFGMSKVLPRLLSLKQLCGTPYYTAPEIINGSYSHECDLWSLGVITYRMIFGFPPFYVDPNKYFGINETNEIYKLILKGFNPIIQNGYGAFFPKSLSCLISKNGMDFIGNLLETNIGKRFTAKEALQHPWLNCTAIEDEYYDDCTLNIDNNDLNATPFVNFCISHKFKYAISVIFREQYKNMRPKYFENLKELFIKFDKDKNGKISYEEFEEGMFKCEELKLNKNKIKQIFNELDLDKNGEIEFENLLDATVHDYLVASDVRLYEAFIDLDIHENGKIHIDLLIKKICEMNIYDNDNINDILSIINDVDLNNDGMIDYQEFLRALHPDFNKTPNWFWKSSNNIYSEEKQKIINQSKIEIINEKNNKIIKEGWMKKEGKLIHSWRLRYFKLNKNGIMAYYYNKNEIKAIASFNVKRLTQIKNKTWGNKIYGIKVCTPHRNWKFSCENNKERNEWINVIGKIAGYDASQVIN